MIAIKTDPFPDDAALEQLWQLSWGGWRGGSFQPVRALPKPVPLSGDML
jgi:hypothetical protein